MAAGGLIIGAARSGSGKTTLTLALLAALRRRGLAIRAAKSGPDYIDPAFLAAASGAPCPNLDSWAMAPGHLDRIAAGLGDGADLVLIESAMGLFDGVNAEAGRSGAAADLAARFRLPVLLVLDVSGQSQTAAAVARGFMTHDPAVRIAGVVLNRVGSDRHRDTIAQAMTALGLPVLGSIPRDPTITLPERHLGLVQASEHTGLTDLFKHLADLAERTLDIDGILAHAAPLQPDLSTAPALPPPGQRIALARDAAFSFVYAHLLDAWRAAGAEIIPFSPLADEAPRDDCDTCWLPGGYPELHGATLARADRFRSGMIQFARTRAVHGECGGHMVLGATMTDASGTVHPMLGLLSQSTSFAHRRLHLGYREATLLGDCAIGAAGDVVRGHEFHYASITDPGSDSPLALLTDASGKSLGPAGGRRGTVTGSFFSCHCAGRFEGTFFMSRFATMEDLAALCRASQSGDEAAVAAVRARQDQLTKPPGSLGQLEHLVAWLARWQGRVMPRLDRVEILVFAGNHGVVARNVSPYPPEVTAQMVANFSHGGAAINQLAKNAGAALRVVPLSLDAPTQDFTLGPAMAPDEFLTAVSVGFAAVSAETDLLALGEMGIGNTTAAAALTAALFGGGGARWAGRGTGVDDAGLDRKQAVIDQALARHAAVLGDPLGAAMAVGGRELAAILGAVLAARQHRIPVLLDGFVCSAAAAPLAVLRPGGLDHARIAHLSTEAGHLALAAALGQLPLLDLGMRLGEASGAAVAIPVVRAALACHVGMATFAEAGVHGRD